MPGTIRLIHRRELAGFGRRSKRGFHTEITEITEFEPQRRISTGNTGLTGKEMLNEQ
jgi:hypothetical protein